MFTKTHSRIIPQLLTALLGASLLLAACSPTDSTTKEPDPTAASTPVPAVEPTVTAAPPATNVPAAEGSLDISLDTGGTATSLRIDTVAAVLASENAPYWKMLPEYTVATLQGYPVSNHLMEPQIFIYDVKALGEANEGAGEITASLESMLQSAQETAIMPFLPLVNATQVMHKQLQYLDFKDGQGVRYLTEFSQGIVPLNNHELIYTFQGLTSDGKYYVAAVLPVTHPSLPADGTISGDEPPEFGSDYLAYLENAANALSTEAANTFTPDLTLLDAVMNSLEIK